MPTRIREDLSKRSRTAKHFLNDDGSYTADICNGPIHYSKNNEWHDIDTTVVVSDDPAYDFMNIANDVQTYFTKEISGNTNNVKIVKDGVTVKLKSGTALKLHDSAGVESSKVLTKVKPEKDARGKANKVRYPSVHSQGSKKLDIDYDVLAGKLHEEFVVNEPMGFPKITQEVELSGGYAELIGKAILIKSSATDEVVMEIPPPVMFEQGDTGIRNYDLVYETSDLTKSVFTVTKVLEPKGSDWFFSNERKYPLIVDTDFTSTASANGGITGSSSSYATARSTSSWYTPDGSDIPVGQYYAPPYAVDRGYLRFNTSSISSSATISSVTMTLTASGDLSNTDFDLQIVDYNWSSYDPITGQEAAYDGCLSATLDNVWRNTSGMSVDTPYTSGALSTSWVNKGGNTYYGLRSVRDYDNTTPSGYERVTFYNYTVGTTTWRPKLSVTYTLSTTYNETVSAAVSCSSSGSASVSLDATVSASVEYSATASTTALFIAFGGAEVACTPTANPSVFYVQNESASMQIITGFSNSVTHDIIGESSIAYECNASPTTSAWITADTVISYSCYARARLITLENLYSPSSASRSSKSYVSQAASNMSTVNVIRNGKVVATDTIQNVENIRLHKLRMLKK